MFAPAPAMLRLAFKKAPTRSGMVVVKVCLMVSRPFLAKNWICSVHAAKHTTSRRRLQAGAARRFLYESKIYASTPKKRGTIDSAQYVVLICQLLKGWYTMACSVYHQCNSVLCYIVSGLVRSCKYRKRQVVFLGECKTYKAGIENNSV